MSLLILVWRGVSVAGGGRGVLLLRITLIVPIRAVLVVAVRVVVVPGLVVVSARVDNLAWLEGGSASLLGTAFDHGWRTRGRGGSAAV